MSKKFFSLIVPEILPLQQLRAEYVVTFLRDGMLIESDNGKPPFPIVELLIVLKMEAPQAVVEVFFLEEAGEKYLPLPIDNVTVVTDYVVGYEFLSEIGLNVVLQN